MQRSMPVWHAHLHFPMKTATCECVVYAGFLLPVISTCSHRFLGLVYVH